MSLKADYDKIGEMERVAKHILIGKSDGKWYIKNLILGEGEIWISAIKRCQQKNIPDESLNETSIKRMLRYGNIKGRVYITGPAFFDRAKNGILQKRKHMTEFLGLLKEHFK